MNCLRKTITALCPGIFCIFLLSCNKEIPCSDAISVLNFVSFPEAETDTMVVRRFTKATNFVAPLDTFFITKFNSFYLKFNDTLQIGNSFAGDNGLKSKYDYEVYLPQTNRLFKINEITEEFKKTSGGGLFAMDSRGCSNPIKSYKLNGQLISGDYNYLKFYIRR